MKLKERLMPIDHVRTRLRALYSDYTEGYRRSRKKDHVEDIAYYCGARDAIYQVCEQIFTDKEDGHDESQR